MSDETITCIVPTHNRPHFLRRLLKFYKAFPPSHPFLIVDTSHAAAAAENVTVINDAKESLKLDYRHVDMNYIDKCVYGLQETSTPYAIFCADDDLIFPDAIRPCVEFLNQSPQYSAALGKTVQISPTRPIRPARQLQVLRGYSIEQPQPLDRCRQMITQLFSSYYAVYRTEILRDNFRLTSANTDTRLNAYGSEMMLSQLSVLRGKIKVLPMMYSIRERHDDNLGSTVRDGVQQEPEALYQRFKSCLAAQLVQTGVAQSEADRYLDQRFGFLRDSHYGTRRRRRSVLELLRQTYHGIVDRIADQVWTDQPRFVRRLMKRDIVGCGPAWDFAVQLIREYPKGITVPDSASNQHESR